MTASIVLTDRPDITITVSPNEDTWCAKEVTFVDGVDPAVNFTSGRGMQVCLSCHE